MANTDDIKGRAKEAAGALTNDDGLKREGKADKATGKVKDVVDKAGDKGMVARLTSATKFGPRIRRRLARGPRATSLRLSPA